MSASPNLQLPYLDANQNQKSVTHNQALRMLDALVGLGVQSSALQAPPAAPADGGRWIVASGGTGAWAGKDLNVAAWQDGAWSFYAPVPGFVAFDAGQSTLVVWTGAAWAPLPALLQTLGVAALGVGTAADRNNPLSATLNDALFNALPSGAGAGAGGTGDVRVKLNKAAAGNTASFLFQDGFSGRAEIGLAGDDNFHFKVSPDGASFFDAIVVAGAGGAVSFLLSPTAPTPASGDSSTRLATTAFVAAAVGSGAGAKGATGATGPQGAAGATGATGPQGTTGATGLQGTAGATGAMGPQGTAGATGVMGPQGAAGTAGAMGPQGTTGTAGATGATGSQGPAGTSVTIKGSVSTNSSLPTSGNALGDGYIASDTGHLWVYSNSTAGGSVNGFVDVGLVRGPVGPQGTAGVAGATGSTGPQGTAGTAGAAGATGPQGTAGAAGATGATGPQGTAGTTGATGPQGTAGVAGATGSTGPQGTAGTAGAAGATGPQGAVGATGPTGPQGATGSAGFARTQVSDAAYTVLASDRSVAMIALTAARTLALPAASAYPAGAVLTVLDESGACSATNTITLAAAGSDRVNGAASAVIAAPFGYLGLESNTSNKWTIVDVLPPVSSVAGRTGAVVLAVADVSGAAPLASPALTGTPTAPTAAAGDNSTALATTSFVAASFVTYGYAGATYATAANATLTGTPTAPTQAIADNSQRIATTAYADRAAAQGTQARTQVNDASYAIKSTDRVVAVVAISAARTLTLPASASYPQGATLTIFDESGACSSTNTITVAASGSDLVNGAASSVIASARGYLALQSNGYNKYTVVDAVPTGTAGATGPQGASGATGATGPTGPQGTAGPAGATGATGPGVNAPSGATGPVAAYTTTASDTAKVLVVTTGSSDTTVTLGSASAVGDGPVQQIVKGDAGTGKVVVQTGDSTPVVLAWLLTQNDVAFLRSNGAAWSVYRYRIQPWRQVLTASGSVTVPPLFSSLDLALFKGGTGGGAGARQATTAARAGGTGGGISTACFRRVNAADLPPSGTTIAVTVGAGGAGAAGATADGTAAVAGVQGGNTSFGTYADTVSSSGLGYTTGVAGTGGAGAGAAANSTAAVAGSNGNIASEATYAGMTSAQTGVGTGGTTSGTAPTAGAVPTGRPQDGGSGGGGGAYITGQAGMAGAAGGPFGGGGGGGAASDNGFASGAGGQGGSGGARITWNFGE